MAVESTVPLAIDIAPQATTLQEHIRVLRERGYVVFPATRQTFWQGAEMRSLALRPEFTGEVPSREEIRKLLWRTRSPLATYVCRSDAAHPQNAWLYVCENQNYCLEKVDKKVRTNIRRALRSFRFEFLDDATLQERGAKAFCDTRSRAGLSDGTPAAFQEMVAAFTANPGRAVLGAWAGDRLAAFSTLVIVDDWIDIYPYAAEDHLIGRPVNGLVHYVLDYFLAQRKFRLVNLGLSSVQEKSGAQGLHAFKKKIGFECRPVHRTFVFHPLLAPLATRAALWGLRALRAVRPGSPAVRKAAGMLACHLGANPMPADESLKSED